MRWIIRAVGTVFAGLLLSACHQGATSFTVDTTADTVDVNPGDGACSDASGDCSLRAAIQEANALPGVEEIQLSGASTYALTIAGGGEDAAATGDLDITSDVVLLGNGATIDATGMANAFELLQPGGLVELDHIHVVGAGSSAIRVASGISTLTDVELSGNTTGLRQIGGTVFFWASTVWGNAGDGFDVSGGVTQLQNTTLSGNGGAGFASSAGSSTLIHSTVTGNDDGIVVSGGSVDVRGSIVTEQATGADCVGAIVSSGHNLESDASCGFDESTDLIVVSAGLGPLANNGGPVSTHLPALASAALNSATSTICTTGAVDARGVARPIAGYCDRGAVEIDTVGADCQPLAIGPGAQLQNCDLGGMNLALANLAGADLTGANLTGATLILADLSGATLDAARFDNADLTDADLSTTQADAAVFDSATVLRTDLTGAVLVGAALDGVVGTSLTTVPASLPPGWAILQQRLFGVSVDLSNLDLTGLDLSNLDLRNTNLTATILATATISGTQFAGADMTDIFGRDVVGTPASMPTDFFVESNWILGPGLNIVGQGLGGADFTGADFTGKNLSGIRFGANTIINFADFSGADLSYAILDGVTAVDADLRTANVWRLQGRLVTGDPLMAPGWVRSLRILWGPGAVVDGITKGTPAAIVNADLTDAIISNTTIDMHISDSTLVRTSFLFTSAANGDTSIINSDATDAVFDHVDFQVFGTPEISNTNLTRTTFSDSGGIFIFNENNVTDTDFGGMTWATESSLHSHKRTTGWGITGTPVSLPAGFTLANGILLPDDGTGELHGDASGVDFSGLAINGTWLDATLTGADLSDGFVKGFDGADLTGANLTDTRVTSFVDTELGGATLTGADLRDIESLDNSGIPVAMPTGFQLEGGRFLGPWAVLDGADLDNLNLTGVDLTAAGLTNADLTNTVLALGDLRGTSASGADFTGANLFGTRIDGADFTGATWSATICPDASNTDTNGSGTCVGHDMTDRWNIVLDPMGAATPLAAEVFAMGDSLPDPRLVFESGTTILEGPPDNGVDWFIDGVVFRDDDHNAPFQISAMSALPTGVPFNGQGPAGSGNTFILDVGIHTITTVAATPTGPQTFSATFRIDEA